MDISKVGNICRSLNGLHWRFDISGFAEDLQYTRYNSDGCFYGWHIDNGVKGSEYPQRKLSITLQLSDASEYEGGDFQFTLVNFQHFQKEKGLVDCVFPSYSLHQVTPVTKGK